MMLADFTEIERYTDGRFASEINGILKKSGYSGVAARSVANWRKGLCMPRLQVIEAIDKFTGGRVIYADHLAAVMTAKEAKRKAAA